MAKHSSLGVRRKGRRSGKPFVPTTEQRAIVSAMSGYVGVPQEDICQFVRNTITGDAVDAKTLRLHFRDELDGARVRRIGTVANALYKNCLNGNVTAQIFFLKTQARWREPTEIEISGPSGGAIPVGVSGSVQLYIPENGRAAHGGNGNGNGGAKP